MEFCDICNNMLYMKTKDSGMLERYCKKCGNTSIEPLTGKCICVSKTVYSENDLLFAQSQNKYLQYDPTLPRVSDIECPNAACTRKSDQGNQVLFVKYNPVQLHYFYCCDYCGHTWRKNDSS